MGHGDTDAAKDLDAFGKQVDQLYLFAKMFVEEEVELIESRAGYLPMRLLVEVTQGGGIGEEIVEFLSDLEANILSQTDGQLLNDCAEFLDGLRGLPGVGGNQVAAFLRCFFHS